LQVAGTRIIHPFWDGNGRTFGVHIAKILNPEGKFFNFISNQAWQIKRVLLKEGLIRPNPRDDKRLKLEQNEFEKLPPAERAGKIIFIQHKYASQM